MDSDLDSFLAKVESVSAEISKLVADTAPVQIDSAASTELIKKSVVPVESEIVHDLRTGINLDDIDEVTCKKWWKNAVSYMNFMASTSSSEENESNAAKKNKKGVLKSGKIDYSHWDRWVERPDDPVSMAEKNALEAEFERQQNAAFEASNPGFVSQWLADAKRREEMADKRSREKERLKKEGNNAAKLDQCDVALRRYKQALEVEPLAADVLANMAAVALQQARIAGAETSLQPFKPVNREPHAGGERRDTPHDVASIVRALVNAWDFSCRCLLTCTAESANPALANKAKYRQIQTLYAALRGCVSMWDGVELPDGTEVWNKWSEQVDKRRESIVDEGDGMARQLLAAHWVMFSAEPLKDSCGRLLQMMKEACAFEVDAAMALLTECNTEYWETRSSACLLPAAHCAESCMLPTATSAFDWNASWIPKCIAYMRECRSCVIRAERLLWEADRTLVELDKAVEEGTDVEAHLHQSLKMLQVLGPVFKLNFARGAACFDGLLESACKVVCHCSGKGGIESWRSLCVHAVQAVDELLKQTDAPPRIVQAMEGVVLRSALFAPTGAQLLRLIAQFVSEPDASLNKLYLPVEGVSALLQHLALRDSFKEKFASLEFDGTACSVLLLKALGRVAGGVAGSRASLDCASQLCGTLANVLQHEGQAVLLGAAVARQGAVLGPLVTVLSWSASRKPGDASYVDAEIMLGSAVAAAANGALFAPVLLRVFGEAKIHISLLQYVIMGRHSHAFPPLLSRIWLLLSRFCTEPACNEVFVTYGKQLIEYLCNVAADPACPVSVSDSCVKAVAAVGTIRPQLVLESDVPLLASVLASCIETVLTQRRTSLAAKQSPARLPCLGNACKLAIVCAGGEAGNKVEKSGLLEAIVDTLKQFSDVNPADKIGTTIRKNAAVAVAKFAKDPHCGGRIRELRGVEILLALGDKVA